MRRFVLEVIVFFTLLFASLLYLYRLNKPVLFQELERLKGKIEIVNLGTSHGWDFQYNKIPVVGLNFNVAGNTLYYDLQNYRYLRNKNYLAENAIIVLPVSYFVFGLDENRTDGALTSSFVNDFYYYLPAKNIYDYSLQKEVELDIYKIQKNFNKLITPDKKPKPTPPLIEKPVVKRSENPASTHVADEEAEKAMEKEREARTKELEDLNEKRVEHHLKLSKYSAKAKNISYLETLLKEILAAGDRPILVTTPYPQAYNKGFGREYLEQEYFSIMDSLSVKYNVPYLDYSHDERFTGKPSLFMDTDHLNPEGRILFTSIFYADAISALD